MYGYYYSYIMSTFHSSLLIAFELAIVPLTIFFFNIINMSVHPLCNEGNDGSIK